MQGRDVGIAAWRQCAFFRVHAHDLSGVGGDQIGEFRQGVATLLHHNFEKHGQMSLGSTKCTDGQNKYIFEKDEISDALNRSQGLFLS